MYYGPNYDASSAGVSSAVSTSPSVSSPDPPTDKELCEPDVPCDQGDHDCVEDDHHRNDDNHVEHHDQGEYEHHDHVEHLDHPCDQVDDLDCGDLDQGDDPDHGDAEEDDDDDWITPDNLHRAREQMGGATTVSAKGVAVGCLTTDFSMQVYLQIIH